MTDASSTYEQCRKSLEELSSWYAQHRGGRNEATTRVQLIDRLFFECLGWSRDDMTAEDYHGGEFADYVFSAPRKLLIVEAKKEGSYFELPSGMENVEYSLKTLSKDYPNVKSAIEQVADYCYKRGVPNAAVCNGHQVVAFIALRLDMPALEGRALVFPSLQFMSDHFLDLWQALSKKGIEGKKLQDRLGQRKQQEPPQKLSQSILGYPGIKGRNIVQTDLQILSEVVIEDITRSREIEEMFLKECYCQSGALSQYSLTTKSILEARYSALFSPTEQGPTLVPAVTKHGMSPDLLAESLSRRPILLIGDVGVGKSIFIRNLIKIDASSVAKNSITLYIDFGSQATLSQDLRSSIFTSLTHQLREEYGVDIEERNFVRGVYDKDLKGFKASIYGDLAKQNPELFMEKEIAFLESKINDRQEFLSRCLQHLSKGRKQQIIVILDNSDQRDEKTQQDVFLIAQELAERWSVIVFVALRPETSIIRKKLVPSRPTMLRLIR
ncbi:MAG: AAA family ATPase [Nitrospira sp.]|nr:AAA family ATPase [Nitrospira sp.]